MGENQNLDTAGGLEANPWPKERFRIIYETNYDDLWRYCLRRSATPTEAEEVMSETFAVAWQKLDQVPEASLARPWLFAVARNHLRNRWRKTKRAKALTLRLVNESATAGPGIDPADIASGGGTNVLSLLSELKDSDQEVLRLSCWDRLPQSEIAKVLGCSENAVAIRLHRAKDRLEKKLNKKVLKGSVGSQHVVADGATNATKQTVRESL